MGFPGMAVLVHHNFWRHRWLFALALSGAVISLNNAFSFPLAAGQGGGAFVVAYLAAHLLVAVPIIMTELMIGRRARHSVPHSLAHLSAEAFVSQKWRYLGMVIVVTGALIAAYYLAFSSWALEYIGRAASGNLPATESDWRFVLAELVANPGRMILLHTIVCVLVFIGLALPSQWGLQLPVAAMAVVLFAGVAGLGWWAWQNGVWADGVDQLLDVHPGTVSLDTWVRAAALSFYSLSLGLGISLVLGAHMDHRISIGATALWVVLIDLLWSLVFAASVLGFVSLGDVTDAIDFIFIDLPLSMNQAENSTGWVLLFFTVLLFSGVSTGLFLVKNSVMWLHERYLMPRHWAALTAMSLVWLVGSLIVLSFNVWREVRFYGATILDWVATVPGNLILPAVCLLLVIFAGWVMPAQHSVDELRPTYEHRFKLWRFSLKFVTTVALLSVLVVQVETAWSVHWSFQLLLLALVLVLSWSVWRYRHWHWESS